MNWEIFNWKVAAFGGIATALLGIWQAYEALKQRKKEHRWRKAELAKNLIDEIYDKEESHNALLLIDDLHKVIRKEGEKIDISIEEVISALSNLEKESNEKIDYIYTCFDILFYYFDRLEGFINIGLIDMEDVSYPAEYYIKQLSKNMDIHMNYINHIGYKRAGDFIRRFEDYKKAKKK